MNTQEKKDNVKQLVADMLNESYEAMVNNIDKVLNSGAIDIDNWDEKYMPMFLPKCILTAILQHESHQYEGEGTSFKKQIDKEVRHIRYYL